MEDFFQVGIITSAHGVRGEVKVYPTTDDVRRFKRLREVFLDTGNSISVSPDTGNRSGRTVSNTGNRPGGAISNTGALPGNGFLVMEIESVKFFKQFAILKFKGIDCMEEAEKYRKIPLMVPRSKAVPLGKDEYYTADLMGLIVKDEDGTDIGVLREVLETGANDVYIIDLNDGRELLLPAIRQCVLEVDVEAGFIRIHILEGLL